MDEQSHNHGHSVHSQLTPDLSQVPHLNNLPSDEEEDSHRGVPDRQEG